MDDEQKTSHSRPDLSAYGFSRSLNTQERDSQIAGVLKRIIELEQRTNPAGGEATAVGKDALASEALALAGWLVHLIAGWALNHQYGLALKGLDPVPDLPPVTERRRDGQEERAADEYRLKRRVVDSHEYERVGAAASREPISDALAARRFLINAFLVNPGGFQLAIQDAIIEALRSLDYGEVTPLVREQRKRLKRNYRERRLQLNALEYVEYWNERGTQLRKAQKEVADAFGYEKSNPSELLASWKEELRKQFGEIEVLRALSFARNAAKAHLLSLSRKLPPERMSFQLLEDLVWYHSNSLKEAGSKYKGSLASRQSATKAARTTAR